jgi:hypothetical protein
MCVRSSSSLRAASISGVTFPACSGMFVPVFATVSVIRPADARPSRTYAWWEIFPRFRTPGSPVGPRCGLAQAEIKQRFFDGVVPGSNLHDAAGVVCSCNLASQLAGNAGQLFDLFDR